jgi:DNA-binding protein HU-beta
VTAVNKSDLISAVAEAAGMSKKQSGDAVNAVFDSIKRALQKGQEVKLVGVGTFKVIKTAARVVRNPRNGEPVKVPAGKKPKFVAGKELKEAVNGK